MKNSTKLLHRIFFRQFPDPLQFMEDIEDWFNFKGYGGDKKRNTVWIHGPPKNKSFKYFMFFSISSCKT